MLMGGERGWLFGSLLSLAVGCGVGGESKAPVPGSLLISGATLVLPESNELSVPQDILIVEGEILEVAAAGTVPRERAARFLEADGLFALPGLIDVHAHIGDGGVGAQSAEDREGALAQFLRYGVTTIFAPGGGGGNEDDLQEWKRRCRSSELSCPGLYGSGAILTAPGGHPIGTLWNLPANADPAVAYARGAIALAEDEAVGPVLDRKVEAGVDAVKIVIEDGPGPWYPKPRLSLEKVEELVRGAHERKLPIFAHVSLASHVQDAVAAGADGVMHSAEDPISDLVFQRMAEERIFYVATLALYEGFSRLARGDFDQDPYAVDGVSARALASLEDPEFRESNTDEPEEMVVIEAALDDNLRRAVKAGVPLALGTDVNNPWVFPGYSVHQELVLMTEAGLTPAQALDAATRGGAAFLRAGERLGRIAPGFEADILLLSKDPLEDVRHSRALHTVLADGRPVADIVAAPD